MRDVKTSTIRALSLWILPLLMVAQFLMNLDRSSIGFAALDMNKELGLSPTQFGFIAGIFFWGYLLFEIPSNFALQKFGARKWIGRILVSWGLVTFAFAAATGFQQLAVLRFLLGAAEAGLTPGTFLLLSQWWPEQFRGRAVSKIVFMSPLAAVAGGPMSAFLLTMDGTLGFTGWRWVFMGLGVLTVAFGVIFYLLMPNSVYEAKFLSEPQKDWLRAESELEAQDASSGVVQHSFLASLKSSPVWAYTFSYFSASVAIFGLFLWLPQLVRSQFIGLTSVQVSMVTAIPFMCGMASVLILGKSSDKTRDRRWHLVVIALVGAIGLASSALISNRLVSFVALCVGVAAAFAYVPIFWTSPMRCLKGTAAVGGTALINSLGTFGGFFGPSIFGALKEFTGTFNGGLAMFAAFFLLAGLMPMVRPQLFPRATTRASTDTQQIPASGGSEEKPRYVGSGS